MSNGIITASAFIKSHDQDHPQLACLNDFLTRARSLINPYTHASHHIPQRMTPLLNITRRRVDRTSRRNAVQALVDRFGPRKDPICIGAETRDVVGSNVCRRLNCTIASGR